VFFPLVFFFFFCRTPLTNSQNVTYNSSVASFLFPVFASYKALKVADPAELSPWLMYWVVLGCALFVESWLRWILVWYVQAVASL
jgi:hypothetical protein